jgi:ADP-heptose:LPS heptosyltransferase
MMPILKQDATFISLQYKDAPEVSDIAAQHGVDIRHWPHATQTGDYDDTAALVAELDLVITVQQSAVHLAGALGTPAWVMLPKAPLWRYGVAGEESPWYKSVKLYRQKGGGWVENIATVARDLRNLIQKGAAMKQAAGDG